VRPSARLLLLAALAPVAAGAEIPDAVIVLEAPPPPLPGYVAEAAPPRFVLMEDGQVFVGGTSRLAAGRLSGPEKKELERRVAEVRKLPGLTGAVTLGPGDVRRRLVLRKGRPLDATLTGDPAGAPAGLKPLAALVESLASFQHPSLKAYEPSSYALSAREGELPGGCRPWTRPEPLDTAVFAPRVIPAAMFGEWPTGATPASVCVGDKKYVVTFRPLLPGERP
jgi:hypothetical protein